MSAATPTTTSVDTWIALLAGDRVWRSDNQSIPAAERRLAGLMLAALLCTCVVLIVAVADRVSPANGLTALESDLVQLAACGLVACAALGTRATATALGTARRAAPFAWSLMWRTVAYAALIVTLTALIPRFRFLAGVPIAFVAAPDVYLGVLALGLAPEPRTWPKRLAVSTLHFGVLGALLATSIRGESTVLSVTFLSVYAGMWIGGATVAIAVAAMQRWQAALDDERAASMESARAEERGRRAHWLHDDILSEVRLTTLRVEALDTPDGVVRELYDLDHRLRLRQLDESLRDGTPHIYEVLQPHLRRLQTLGITLQRVPPLEATELRIDEASGHLVHRVISGLLSNALNAGASTISIAMQVVPTPARLVVAVTDDAGGFDLDDIPPARGLSQLRTELGPNAIFRAPAPGGSRVVAAIPVSGPFTNAHLEKIALSTDIDAPDAHETKAIS